MRKLVALAGTIALLSGVGALASAPLANAGDDSEGSLPLTVTCEAVKVSLHGYPAETPAVDAIPGSPGQPYIAPTYKTVVVTPAIPAIPAIPATYVQEWLYVQHETGKTKWMPEGWNGIVHGVDHGEGWHYVQPEQHRDTNEILTPAIPAVPAVPAVTQQVMVDPGQPYIAPTPGTPAVPAKANTVKLTIDGTPVIDTTFGTDFTSTKLISPIMIHFLHLQVDGWDGTGKIDQWMRDDPCVGPINVVTLPQPIVTQPTGQCDDGKFVVTPGTVKLVPSDHYVWGDFGQDKDGVIHNVAPGTYTYTAMPNWGYALEATSVVAKVETPVSNECTPAPTNTVPAPAPTSTTVPTTPATTPSASAAATTQVAAVAPQGAGPAPAKAAAPNNQWLPDLAAHNESSASTDVDPMGWVLGGVSLIAFVGLALLLVRTRRGGRHAAK